MAIKKRKEHHCKDYEFPIQAGKFPGKAMYPTISVWEKTVICNCYKGPGHERDREKWKQVLSQKGQWVPERELKRQSS